MHQYGLVLEDFQNNGEFINDCVFTMMHHVGGDLEEPSALLQPNILNTFSQIWEMDFELCDVGILLLNSTYSGMKLCYFPCITVLIKARVIRWASHIVCIWETKNI